MITLIHHFHHQTCSTLWLLNLCLGTVSDNQHHIFFLNVLLGHSRIVINFVHSCMINTCQSKKSHTRKNYLENYIAILPRLIITIVPNCFGEFVIFRNTVEFCRQYGVLKNVLWPQVSVNPHDIFSHYRIISAKHTNIIIVKLLRFQFKYGIRLVIYSITKILYIT